MATFMNKQRERHMSGGEEGKGGGGGAKPSIHIHSHSKGHTVHIMHSNGMHEKHEHAHGDAEGIAQHVHTHLGESGGGQDHGFSSGDEDQDDFAGV